MKNKLLILIMIITLAGMFSACANKVDVAKEEEQVRELWNKVSEYGMKGDWENYKKYFDQTEKLQIIHPGAADWLKGWDEFSARYKVMLESGNTWTEHKNDLLNVNISKSGDMAWGIADFTFSFPSNPEQKYHMWEAVVFEKIDGEWKSVMGMACSVPNAE